MKLETTLSFASYTGLIVMAVLGIILWGDIDIRFMFGATALTVLTIYVSIIGKSIYDSYTIIKKTNGKRKKK